MEGMTVLLFVEGVMRKMLEPPDKERQWEYYDPFNLPRRESLGFEGPAIAAAKLYRDTPSACKITPLNIGRRQPIGAAASHPTIDSDLDLVPSLLADLKLSHKTSEDQSSASSPSLPKVGQGLKDDVMSVILCTAGYDHTIRFWEALSGICSRTIQHPESQVNRLCITPNKRYLAAAGRHAVRLYDVASTNPNPVLTFEGHSNNIMAVAFHCDGKWMVTASEDCTVKVWDTRTGLQQRNYPHSHAVNDVVIHPNQGELISADRGGSVRIWDLGMDTCSHQLIPEEGVAMSSVSVASDGSLLAAGNNHGDVYLWRMYQHKDSTGLLPCRSFKAHSLHLTRLLISPDVKTLATCSADHSAKIWKIDPAEEFLEEIPKDFDSKAGVNKTSPVGTIGGTHVDDGMESGPLSFGKAIHAGGTDHDSLPSSLKNSSHVQHFPAGKSLPLEVTLDGHQRWVWDCAFSADSAYLVTVSSDHYARLWELSTGAVIRQYNGHHRGAVAVALNDYSEPR